MKKKLLALLGVLASATMIAACALPGFGGSESESSMPSDSSVENSIEGSDFSGISIGSENSDGNLGESSEETSSEEVHTHTWATEWSNDENNHWHACDGCEEVSDENAHTGGAATCISGAICEVCGIAYGDADETLHIEGTPATCTSPAICSVCNQPYGDPLPHTEGTAATCTDEAICSVCNESYGEKDEENHTGTIGWISYPESSTHAYAYSCCGALDPDNEDFFCRGGVATCAAKAVCEICGGEYGELDTTNHAALGAWDTSAEDVDTASCECGETVTFKKLFTEQKDIIWANAKTLDLSAELDGTLKSASFNGASVSGTVDAIDLSALPLQNHGEGTLEMVVTDKYGVDHNVKYALLVITNKFAGNDDRVAFRDATRGVKATCTEENPKLYGYYILTEDLSTTWSDTDYPELWGASLPVSTAYGFAGTIIGEKEDGSAPVIKATPKSGGIFGYLQEATIKNIIFEDHYYRGSASAGPLVGTIAKGTTFENVTFKVKVVNPSAGVQQTSGWSLGWIINNEISNMTFKNVNFINESGSNITLGRLLSDQNTGATFENCTIENFAEVLRVYGATTPAAVTGLTVKNHVHDFENSTEYKYENNQHWKVCASCEVEDTGNKVDCSGEATTCGESGTCTACGNEYTVVHKGGIANCTDLAICEICNQTYGDVDSNNHKGITSWDTSAADKDIGTCECGVTTEFRKDYLNEKPLEVIIASTTVLDISSYFPADAKLNWIQYDGKTTNRFLTSGESDPVIDFSPVKDKLDEHGNGKLVLSVVSGGQAHTVKMPVRLVTDTIDSAAKINMLLNFTIANNTEVQYGFYKVTNDFNHYSAASKWGAATGNGIAKGSTAGFMGTLYGEKADGSRPTIRGNGCNAGMFAPFNKATIENIIFTDNNVKGSGDPNASALLNYNTYDTKFINCDFVIKATGGGYSEEAPATDWNKGWLVVGVASDNTFTNCNFINETANSLNLYRLMGGNGGANNTFTNCTMKNMTATYVFNKVTSVTGLTTVA